MLSVGTGQALRMGKDGNVDVVMVHAPKAERRFVEAGFGVKSTKCDGEMILFL